jgi:uncharacterized protein YdcH (DUF465 family)
MFSTTIPTPFNLLNRASMPDHGDRAQSYASSTQELLNTIGSLHARIGELEKENLDLQRSKAKECREHVLTHGRLTGTSEALANVTHSVAKRNAEKQGLIEQIAILESQNVKLKDEIAVHIQDRTSSQTKIY